MQIGKEKGESSEIYVSKAQTLDRIVVCCLSSHDQES